MTSTSRGNECPRMRRKCGHRECCCERMRTSKILMFMSSYFIELLYSCAALRHQFFCLLSCGSFCPESRSESHESITHRSAINRIFRENLASQIPQRLSTHCTVKLLEIKKLIFFAGGVCTCCFVLPSQISPLLRTEGWPQRPVGHICFPNFERFSNFRTFIQFMWVWIFFSLSFHFRWTSLFYGDHHDSASANNLLGSQESIDTHLRIQDKVSSFTFLFSPYPETGKVLSSFFQ